MHKNGQVELGRTKCDICSKPSTQVVGEQVLCNEHASIVKQASQQATLKSAGVMFRHKHR